VYSSEIKYTKLW